jgi:anti-sigma regulatory factor (Ser/Thr protein kinase)
MHQTHAHKEQERLKLNSRLADLALVKPWVDALAGEHAIGEDTVYKIELCLEEALSNIVRHGYKGEPQHRIELSFHSNGDRMLRFAIEDNAPHFNQAGPGRKRAAKNTEDLIPGGHGMPLIRKFSSSVAWEPLPNGNRLTLTFPNEPRETDTRS